MFFVLSMGKNQYQYLKSPTHTIFYSELGCTVVEPFYTVTNTQSTRVSRTSDPYGHHQLAIFWVFVTVPNKPDLTVGLVPGRIIVEPLPACCTRIDISCSADCITTVCQLSLPCSTILNHSTIHCIDTARIHSYSYVLCS